MKSNPGRWLWLLSASGVLLVAGLPAPARACEGEAHDGAAEAAVYEDPGAHLTVDEMERIERYAQPGLERILRKPVPKDLDAQPAPDVGTAPEGSSAPSDGSAPADR